MDERSPDILIRASTAYVKVVADPDVGGPAAVALVAEARRDGPPEALVAALRAEAWFHRTRLGRGPGQAAAGRGGPAGPPPPAARPAGRGAGHPGRGQPRAGPAQGGPARLRPGRPAHRRGDGRRAGRPAGRAAPEPGPAGRRGPALPAGAGTPGVPPDVRAKIANNLGVIESQRGRPQVALGWLDQAAEAAAGVVPTYAAIIAESRAAATVQAGRLTEGLALFEEAARRWQRAGLPLGELHVEQADALVELRLLPEAQEQTRFAVRLLDSEGVPLMAAEAQLRVAQLTLLMGEPEPAAEQAEQVADRFRRQRRASWAARADLVAVEARLRAGTQPAGGQRRGPAGGGHPAPQRDAGRGRAGRAGRRPGGGRRSGGAGRPRPPGRRPGTGPAARRYWSGCAAGWPARWPAGWPATTPRCSGTAGPGWPTWPGTGPRWPRTSCACSPPGRASSWGGSGWPRWSAAAPRPRCWSGWSGPGRRRWPRWSRPTRPRWRRRAGRDAGRAGRAAPARGRRRVTGGGRPAGRAGGPAGRAGRPAGRAGGADPAELVDPGGGRGRRPPAAAVSRAAAVPPRRPGAGRVRHAGRRAAGRRGGAAADPAGAARPGRRGPVRDSALLFALRRLAWRPRPGPPPRPPGGRPGQPGPAADLLIGSLGLADHAGLVVVPVGELQRVPWSALHAAPVVDRAVGGDVGAGGAGRPPAGGGRPVLVAGPDVPGGVRRSSARRAVPGRGGAPPAGQHRGRGHRRRWPAPTWPTWPATAGSGRTTRSSPRCCCPTGR